MKKNYDLELRNLLKKISDKPTLLLHVCCAPCSTYVVDYLKDYFEITVLFYNPNIEPQDEYKKRKAEVKQYLSNYKILDIDYQNDIYANKTKHLNEYKEGSVRCNVCFSLRLEKSAKVARQNNFSYFGTTLTISPHKDASVINKIGVNLGVKYNVKYLMSDFKKRDGFKKSLIISKEHNLYRQSYCGCLISKEGKNEV